MILFAEESFLYFNGNLFNSKLIMPELQIDLTRKFVFRFDGNQNLFQIGIGIFAIKSKNDFCNHILHEMVHIYNYMNRIEDVNNNQYHTMKFANEALRIGLGVKKDRNQGWSLTTFSSQSKITKDFKINNEANRKLNDLVFKFKFDEIKYFNSLAVLNEQQKLLKPSKLFFLKYECSCPPPVQFDQIGQKARWPKCSRYCLQNMQFTI